jgi:hypothetical protein
MAKDRMASPASFHERAASAPAAGSPRVRECAVCGVKLSLYNPGPHCWNHTIGHPWRGPSAKPKF